MLLRNPVSVLYGSESPGTSTSVASCAVKKAWKTWKVRIFCLLYLQCLSPSFHPPQKQRGSFLFICPEIFVHYRHFSREFNSLQLDRRFAPRIAVWPAPTELKFARNFDATEKSIAQRGKTRRIAVSRKMVPTANQSWGYFVEMTNPIVPIKDAMDSQIVLTAKMSRIAKSQQKGQLWIAMKMNLNARMENVSPWI